MPERWFPMRSYYEEERQNKGKVRGSCPTCLADLTLGEGHEDWCPDA